MTSARTAGARLLASEPPSVLGLNGERLEQLGIHRRPRDTPRLIACGQIHVADDECTDNGEGVIDFRELPVFRRRQAALAAARARTASSGTGAAPVRDNRVAARSPR